MDIRIIGVGNEYYSDDALGLIIARSLRDWQIPHTQVIECDGEGTAIIDAWEGATIALIIDAMASGATPGTVFRFDTYAETLPLDGLLSSTHGFGVAEALALACALHRLPLRVLVYAIEGMCFAFGHSLSPPVAQALPGLITQLERDLRSFLLTRTGAYQNLFL
ncbi:hydrogenase maturation protease [Ktedonospora formicarum]|uniref:Peptidase M52 n=1 Tax=Ktedonospora formicarum TaxID=2778364 RepID=A0A8J3MWJ4_9CHLR|nr:hydrogenase maturation protease [Ktedonospora formicarum]GHO48718.1 peptidase M52 [Ktedonospora formicarum]